jgi:nucleotide-binding universal stress UspA family protein
MSTRVLIPIDGSEISTSVINPVHRLLAGVGGVVTFLHVGPAGIAKDWAALKAAEAKLRAMISVADADEFTTLLRAEPGDPAEVITQFIQQTAPDLVAMATHGRSGLTRLAKGSVAETVLRSAGTTTLLCNFHGGRATGPAAPYRRILIPLDGSTLSRSIFASVAHVARAFDAEVVLLRVCEKPLHEDSPEYENIVRRLNRFADRLSTVGVRRTRFHLTHGSAAKTILETVKEERVDLVALATHGRTGLDRLRLGSVAEEVLRSCPCPLLVVGQPSSKQAESTTPS